ncbi:MAG TPA: hypothetical protein VJK72_05550 [Candidatus Nanoarchaeia archaeon]|nr:hypothetical protein [Candidatus Nanoarchaeia archaeon]
MTEQNRWEQTINTFAELDTSKLSLTGLVKFIVLAETQIVRDELAAQKSELEPKFYPPVWTPVVKRASEILGYSPPNGFYDIVRKTLDRCYEDLKRREMESTNQQHSHGKLEF